ncbi:MAG: carotenoid biosynthesis protein [Ferruginibacter sp.]
MIKNISKYQIATAIAIFFHCIGLAGLLFFDTRFFIQSTPFNLLLSFSLLVWTQRTKDMPFLFFIVLVVLVGYFSEVAGVNTGLLFGNYSYGRVLGVQWLQTPLLIGINWFIIIYCCGISTQTLLLKLIRRVGSDSKEPPLFLKSMSIIVDGATLAVVFDWLMEPVAVKLGFWTWNGDGNIPLYNYICWFVISMLLLTIFHFGRFNKENKFAVNLLLIQALFFLILRTFLK